MNSKNKILNVVSFVVLNGLWYYSVYAGIVANNIHWLNFFKFMTWFLVVLWTLNALARGAANVLEKKIGKRPVEWPERYIPGWITFLTDLGLSIFAAVYGHWFYSILIIYQQYMEQVTFFKRKEPVCD